MSTAFAVNHAPGLSGNATFYKITSLKSWAGKGYTEIRWQPYKGRTG
jgi:hypothetical protein